MLKQKTVQRKRSCKKQERLSGDPYGNRTHDYAVKGRRLNLLTNGPSDGCGRT